MELFILLTQLLWCLSCLQLVNCGMQQCAEEGKCSDPEQTLPEAGRSLLQTKRYHTRRLEKDATGENIFGSANASRLHLGLANNKLGISHSHAHTYFFVDLDGAMHSFVDLDGAMKNSEATVIPSAIRVGISAADFVLACCACWVIFLWWRSGISMRIPFLGLTTFPQCALLVSFVSFGAGHTFIMHLAGTTGYSVISATILVYIAKCVISFLMFLCRTDLKAGFDSLLAPGCTRFGELPGCILPMIPGGLLASGDCLTFLGLVNLDPVTFLIFMNLRTVFVGISWELMFRRKLSATQWLALLLFMVAGITKGVDRAHAMNAGGLQTGICITIIKSLTGALACVFAEVLLKEMTMPTDLVNTCTYLWGLVWLVIVMLCGGGASTLYSTLLSATAWSKLQADPCMIGSIGCLVVWGIISAYLLKHLSNIVKESAQAFVIVISIALQWFLIGSSVITIMGMMGVSMAVLGICVYSIDPLQNHDK